MQFHQAADQRQADPQAADRAFERGVQLGEHVENAVQLLGCDADAVVGDADDGFATVALDLQADVAAAAGELAGVGQQVADDLGQPDRVGTELQRAGIAATVPAKLDVGAKREWEDGYRQYVCVRLRG